MRRGFWGPALAVLLLLFVAGAAAAVAYNVGFDNGASSEVDGVRESWRDGHGGWWLFPLFFFPLFGFFFLFVLFSLVRLAWFGGFGWRHRQELRAWHGDGPVGPLGSGGMPGPRMARARFEEWHELAHEVEWDDRAERRGRGPVGWS
jgi:hypothetical protein